MTTYRAAYFASAIIAGAAAAAVDDHKLAEALLLMFVGWVGGVLFAKAWL